MTMRRLTTIQLVLGSTLSLCGIASAHAGSNYETLHTFTGEPDGRGGYADSWAGRAVVWHHDVRRDRHRLRHLRLRHGVSPESKG